MVEDTSTRLRPPAKQLSRWGVGVGASKSIGALTAHGKREDLRVEVLVEGTTVKAGRIHAKLSRAWSTRLGYSMEHHVVYAPSRKRMTRLDQTQPASGSLSQ